MRKLNLAHYAMTLGGYRTTLSTLLCLPNSTVPESVRRAMGITDGLMRVSIGIEDTEDLVNDFIQALEVFKK